MIARVLGAGVLLLVGGGWARAQEAKPTPAPVATPSPEPPAVKITPYGIVYFNGYTNSNAVNNADVPQWAVSGPGNTGASARQTRVGVRVAVKDTFGAKLTGAVEADFFGGFPSVGIGDNFGQLRLRLALARLDWAKTSVVIGQDWMVFAPQNPASLACAGNPLFAGAGNPWARLPQVRLEHRFGPVLAQAAVLSPSSGDFSSTFLVQPSSGMASRIPYLQGRLAGVSKSFLGSGKPGNGGVSGHYGQSRIFVTPSLPTDVDSWGVAADWSLPIGSHVTFAGEVFTGSNLAGFQGGIFQGINPDAVGIGAAGPAGIGTTGGWAQIGFVPGSSRFLLSAGYGLDDPEDDDLRSASRRDWRLRDEVFSAAVTHRSSTHLSLGVEYRHIKTRLLQSGEQEDDHLNLAATLTF